MIFPTLSNEKDTIEVRKALLEIEKTLTSSLGLIPIGSAIPYHGVDELDPYDTGFAMADGKQYPSGDFPIAAEKFGVGGAKTFTVPDYREASPYGVGERKAGVTAHDVATLGEFKDDQLQGHWHETYGTRTTSTTAPAKGIDAAGFYSPELTENVDVRNPVTDGTNGTPRTGTVTRGKLIGAKFIIRLK